MYFVGFPYFNSIFLNLILKIYFSADIKINWGMYSPRRVCPRSGNWLCYRLGLWQRAKPLLDTGALPIYGSALASADCVWDVSAMS